MDRVIYNRRKGKHPLSPYNEVRYLEVGVYFDF